MKFIPDWIKKNMTEYQEDTTANGDEKAEKASSSGDVVNKDDLDKKEKIKQTSDDSEIDKEYTADFDKWYQKGFRYGLNRSANAASIESVRNESIFKSTYYEWARDDNRNPEKGDDETEGKSYLASDNGVSFRGSASNGDKKPDSLTDKQRDTGNGKKNKNNDANDNYADKTQENSKASFKDEIEELFVIQDNLKKRKKKEKYEEELEELRALQGRLSRNYWEGFADSLNDYLQKILQYLHYDLDCAIHAHKRSLSSSENDENSAEQPIIDKPGFIAKLSGDVKDFSGLYQNMSDLKSMVKSGDIDGYDVYKTRMMIYLMILGLFFGMSIEFAFMSAYTGEALETGTFYSAVGSYTTNLNKVYESEGKIGVIRNFPIADWIKVHLIFFFSFLPFVFGFVVKIGLDQVSEKERNNAIQMQNNVAKKWYEGYTLNDTIMLIFIAILIIYSVVLGVVIGGKKSFGIGLYATMLSLSLMVSIGLIMHNLIKTYARYKVISKKGLFGKKDSYLFELNEDVARLVKLIDLHDVPYSKQEMQKKNQERDDEITGKTDVSEGNERNGGANERSMGDSHDKQRDDLTSGRPVQGSEEDIKSVESDYKIDEEHTSRKDKAQERVDAYVKACVGNFESGYEFGCSVGVRGEITENYLKNSKMEELVELNQKYNKYMQLYGDKYNAEGDVDNCKDTKSQDNG